MDAIQEAKRLIRETFGPEYGIDDDMLSRALVLCYRYGGIIVDDGFLFAYFRYWPTQGEAVAAMDFAGLLQRNLSGGPLLHCLAWISKDVGSYRLARALIARLNPYGVSRHVLDDGEWRFAVQPNRAWRRSGGGANVVRNQLV